MNLDDAPGSSPTHGQLADDLQPNPVDAVVFDLGNVLVQWHPARAVAGAVGEERAERFLRDDSFGFAEWNLKQDQGRAWSDAINDKLRTHPHYAEEMQGYVDNFGLSITDPVEGTVEILKELHAAQIPLIALTNWSEELFPAALERHEFLDLFDDIVVSGEEGVAKPDPEIFDVLESRLRHLGGLDDCIFIDDNVDNVQAATAAGMDAIHFTDADHLRADLLVRGLPLRS